MSGAEMYFVKFRNVKSSQRDEKDINYFNFEAADKLKSSSNFSPSHKKRF